MGHPSEYYIKFILAQHWGDEEVELTGLSLSATLKSLGLLGLSDDVYDNIKSNFEPPRGFRFNNLKDQVTSDFMQKEKIYSLWKPAKEDKRVLDELVDGYQLIKRDIHLLLMGDIPHEVIASKITGKYHLFPAITPIMISFYNHYFWNVGNATHEEWEEFLSGKKMKDSYLASLSCGEQQALYRAGFSPKVDSGRALKEAYRQAFFRLEALRFEPDTKGTIDAYSKLSARLLNINAVLHAGGTNLQDQLKEFRQIMMKHKDPAIASIDTIIDRLSGGSYSGDGTKNKYENKENEENEDEEEKKE